MVDGTEQGNGPQSNEDPDNQPEDEDGRKPVQDLLKAEDLRPVLVSGPPARTQLCRAGLQEGKEL